MSLLAVIGCDVHEFPAEDNNKVPFRLHLDFSTEMPLHKEVVYTRGGDMEGREADVRHDVRYIIKAYRSVSKNGENREPDATFVFAKSDMADLNYTADLELYEGTYDFRVWADYVEAGSLRDKYYDTRDFSEIILADKKNHSGSNDYRDAFRGYADATVTDVGKYAGSIVKSIDNQTIIEMKRPMGKFKFISTDADIFMSRVEQMMMEQGLLSGSYTESDFKKAYEQLLKKEFYVVFRYNAFMPCSFNMFTDKPADSWTGISFRSLLSPETEKEMSLGYDYIFVNGSETTLSISVEVYNKEGKLISSTNPINVPVVRSKLTVVKGDFLTSKATGGVTINPGYDGDDYNIEIF